MLKRFLKNQEGGVFVEFAILLPVILSLVFGYMSVVQVVRGQIIMQTAVREGARVYANPIPGENMETLARQTVIDTLEENRQKAGDIKINVYANGEKRYVEIEKTFQFTPIIRWLTGEIYDGTVRTGAVFAGESFDP